MSKIACLLSIAAVMSTAAPASAQRTWVEVTGPNLSVVSDAGAPRAAEVLWQFEQVREAITRTFAWIRVTPARPVVVLAPRNEASMRELAPQFWEGGDRRGVVGVSTAGPDRIYIAVRADAKVEDREGENPYRAVYWSYVAQALNETASGMPVWLLRGLAEVLSNTLVRADQIQVGRVLPGNLQRIRTRPRLMLREVVSAVGRDQRLMGDSEALQTFDATAWAFVHFLAWGDKGAYAPLLDKYVTAVVAGGDPVAALATTLGDVSRFDSAFNVYVNRDIFPYVSFATAARLSREGFPAREVPAADAAALRAGFHVAMNRPAEARALAAEASKLSDGAGDETLALLAERENRRDELHTLYDRAASRPSSSWYSPYRLATLLPTNQGSVALERIETLLEQATARNANADAAWAYLAEVKAALGRGEVALAPAQKAVAMSPSSSGHRLSLARVLMRLGREPDARAEAGRARALARSPEERADAQELLAELAKRAASPSGAPAASAAGSDPSRAAPGSTPGATGGSAGTIVELIRACTADQTSCPAALPVLVADCETTAPGSRVSCSFAGEILDTGRGMPPDPPRAAALYTRGCDRGDQPGCWRLATLRASGRGVDKDVAAALKVLEPACQPGGREACARLGLVLASTGDPKQLAQARTVLTGSCDGGFAPACELLKQLPPPK